MDYIKDYVMDYNVIIAKLYGASFVQIQEILSKVFPT